MPCMAIDWHEQPAGMRNASPWRQRTPGPNTPDVLSSPGGVWPHQRSGRAQLMCFAFAGELLGGYADA